LRLVTPRLGEIDARLSLTPQGARISIVTPVGASAADMLDAAPLLEKSMAAAGVPLLALAGAARCRGLRKANSGQWPWR
jgi:hypothetical protein